MHTLHCIHAIIYHNTFLSAKQTGVNPEISTHLNWIQMIHTLTYFSINVFLSKTLSFFTVYMVHLVNSEISLVLYLCNTTF